MIVDYKILEDYYRKNRPLNLLILDNIQRDIKIMSKHQFSLFWNRQGFYKFIRRVNFMEQNKISLDGVRGYIK